MRKRQNVFDFDQQYSMTWDQIALGNVRPIDSMMEIVFSNKILFTFLSEFIEDLPIQNTLKIAFQKYVPWTRIIRDCKVEFHGNSFELYKLLISKKDNFVVKKAQSAEGKDVFIGHIVPEEKWKKIVEDAMINRNWIVQEFVRSVDDTLILLNSDLGIDENKCTSVLSPYLSQGIFSGYLKRFIKNEIANEVKENSIDSHVFNELGTCFVY